MSYSREDNYCEHGTYVGGCGADYLCGWCEDGTTTLEEYHAYLQREENRKIRYETAVVVCAAMFDELYPADPPAYISSLASSIVLGLWSAAR